MPNNTMLEAALSYARLGWQVLPCRPGVKAPLTVHGCQDATDDEDTIRAWLTRWPTANIAIACGPRSGVYVVDVDLDPSKNVDGWASMREFPDLPLTVRQDTPRGGAHFLFKSDKPPANKNGFRNGIDIRSTGYYIMVPPSLHPNGKRYAWTEGFAPGEVELAEFPDYMRPPERPRLPWERRKPAAPKPATPAPASVATEPAPHMAGDVVERARAYLHKCEPAVQGQAGHDKLLWAARALVVGFELDAGTAINMLWDDYNPRCVPPWDRSNMAECKDFERKVHEVEKTPGNKPRGWLLEETGLRPSEAFVAYGRQLQDDLLAASATVEAQPAQQDEQSTWEPFPVACLPKEIGVFVETAARAHSVDPVNVALHILAVASAAGGTAFQLELKPGWRAFPALWTVVVARTGANKSGPLELVVRPLWEQPPAMDDNEILRAGSQSQWVVTDCTTEAVLALLSRCRRGLLLSADELAGFLGSFDCYRSSGRGGDEQKWIQFWNGNRYVVNRKTDNETTDLRNPLVAITGSIQPEMLAKATDADKLAGGFMARVLLAMPPERKRVWNDKGVQPELEQFWADVVNAIRCRPFAAVNTASGGWGEPNIVKLSPRAAVAFVSYFDEVADKIMETGGVARIMAAKSDVHAARLALTLHLLRCGLGMTDQWDTVEAETMESAVTLARWFTREAIRVFSNLCGAARDEQRLKLAMFIRSRGGKVSVRDIMRSNSKRYPDADAARASLYDLAQAGMGTLNGDNFALKAGV